MPSSKTAATSAFWYTAASFFSKGIGFLTIPLFTRLMTPDEFGSFNAFAAMQVLVVAVVGLEAFQTLNRARFDIDAHSMKKFQFSLLTLTLLIGLLLLVALIIWKEFFEAVTGIGFENLVILVLYVMFFPAFNMFQAYQRVNYKYRTSATLAFAASAASAGAAVLLVLVLYDALFARIAGQYVPFIVLGIAFYIWYLVGARGTIKTTYWKYALPLCLPLVLATLGTQGLVLGSRLVVQQMDSATAAAFIALATSIANITLILVLAVNNAWSPWLLDCLQRSKFDKARSAFMPILVFVALLVNVVSLMAPELILILGGEDYRPTLELVPSFMLAVLLGTVTTQYIFVQIFHKQVRAGGLVTLGAAVLNAVLCVLVVDLVGFVYVGYVSVFAYLVLLCLQKLIVARMPTPDLFPWKTIGPVLLVSALLVPLDLYLYTTEWHFVRYGLVLIGTMLAGYLGLKIIRRIRSKSK